MKRIKNNFPFGAILPSPVPLDCASVFLSHKGTVLLMQRALFREQSDSILSF